MSIVPVDNKCPRCNTELKVSKVCGIVFCPECNWDDWGKPVEIKDVDKKSNK